MFDNPYNVHNTVHLTMLFLYNILSKFISFVIDQRTHKFRKTCTHFFSKGTSNLHFSVVLYVLAHTSNSNVTFGILFYCYLCLTDIKGISIIFYNPANFIIINLKKKKYCLTIESNRNCSI